MATTATSDEVDKLTGADIEVENIYDEIEIDDMDFEQDEQTFYYPCPCGDKFRITVDMLREGKAIATCPSCSLQIRIISDQEFLQEFLADYGITL